MTHKQEDFTLGDPLSIANQGLLSNNGLTIAVQGFLVQIVEEIVEVVGGGGISPGTTAERRRQQAKKYRKKITVTATIDGVEYRESVFVDDLTMKIKDVNVEISNVQGTPKLIIHLPDYMSEGRDDD